MRVCCDSAFRPSLLIHRVVGCRYLGPIRSAPLNCLSQPFDQISHFLSRSLGSGDEDIGIGWLQPWQFRIEFFFQDLTPAAWFCKILENDS
jgi:hypothetical protein